MTDLDIIKKNYQEKIDSGYDVDLAWQEYLLEKYNFDGDVEIIKYFQQKMITTFNAIVMNMFATPGVPPKEEVLQQVAIAGGQYALSMTQAGIATGVFDTNWININVFASLAQEQVEDFPDVNAVIQFIDIKGKDLARLFVRKYHEDYTNLSDPDIYAASLE